MKKTGKSVLSLILTLLLAGLPLCAVPAFAADTNGVFASGYCGGEGDGTNLTWTLTSDGVLTVSGVGRMADYDYYDNTGENNPPWKYEIGGNPYRLLGFSSLNEMNAAETQPSQAQINSATRLMYALERKIVVEEGVTYIGSYAFCNWMGDCVSLPSTLTELGDHSFLHMHCCKELTLPAGVSKIGLNALEGPYFAKITMPAAETILAHNFDFWNGAYEITGKNAALESIPFVLSGWTDGVSVSAQDYADFVTLRDLTAFYGWMCVYERYTVNPPAEWVEMFGSEEEAIEYARYAWFETLLPLLRAYGFEAETVEALKPQLLAAINAILGTELTDEEMTEPDAEEFLAGSAFIAALQAYFAPVDPDDIEFADDKLAQYPISDLPAGFAAAPWNSITVSCTDTWNGTPIADAAEANGWSFFNLRHSYDDGEVTTPPTCAGAGVRTFTCADCGATKTETVPAAGHRHAQTVAGTEATAEAHGYTEGVYCPDCEAWLSGHEVVHNTLGERTYLDEYTEDGYQMVRVKCTVCGGEGLYAMEPVPHTDPPADGNDDGGSEGPFARIRKAIRSFIDWILRLLKWFGAK